MNSTLKKGICEAIGTCVLVVFGCGTAMFSGNIVAVALAFGLSIVTMAYTIGKVSGCHVNPAVSLAMFLDGQMSMADFLNYIIFQCIGAFAGSGILAIIVKTFGMDLEDMSMGANGFGARSLYSGGDYDSFTINWFGALLVEIILTFVFILVIFAVTDRKMKSAGVFIGVALLFVHILGIPLTGTSVNPARSLAPAFFAIPNTDWDSLKQLWVFIVGPVIGALLATIANRALIRGEGDD